MVSGLAPGATPSSTRSRFVAVYVHENVESCVCHEVTGDASGDRTTFWICHHGSSLRWYAYQPEIFCLGVRPHVSRTLLSTVHVPAYACRAVSFLRTTSVILTG